MKKLILASVFAFVAVTSAHAAKPYGTAGCGLGSVLMGKDGNQVLAYTTNGTFSNQWFGITSGTSNCTDGAAMASAGSVPYFVAANQQALAKDIARGNGETLTNLAGVLGCDDSQYLGFKLQSQFKSIFPSSSADSQQVSESIMNTVKSDSKLSQSCKSVG